MRRGVRFLTGTVTGALLSVTAGVAVLALALTVAATGRLPFTHQARSPVTIDRLPPSARSVSLDSCRLSGTSADDGPPVTVDADAASATVVWIPHPDADPCAATITRLDATRARAVAHDVRQSRVTGGSDAFNCPNDTGAVARVYLRYEGLSRLEVVDQELSGCQFASAPGRAAVGPPRTDLTLRALAPAGIVRG